ncbi:hypothetical protein [uncultured Pseudacidovorax sp.]|uniref:hypothetical protein n=1 Tax=uncultured Pseudacidovorax sp. TaxID=679313 RepID=UPI0025FF6617|nr:hypothetical protein [uncultured Pseudacidovorax sp.]
MAAAGFTPELPMLARRKLRLAVVHRLQEAVDYPGVRVLSPGIFPVEPDALPVLIVNVPNESKQSNVRGVPQFNTTMSVVVQGQVRGDTPEAAQDAIEALGYQAEMAILTGYQAIAMLQQFTSVDTQTEVSSDGKGHFAGFKMTFGGEIFESFDPMEDAPAPAPWPLDQPVTTDVSELRLTVDTIQPADKTGTYADPAFPDAVNPAPRVEGPDGRAEGTVTIEFPTT